MIKLCKKYNIEIKSKRRACFSLNHLNFPYKRKTNKYILPIEKITQTDLKLIKNFNFYIKNFDYDEIISNQRKIFRVEKINKVNIINKNVGKIYDENIVNLINKGLEFENYNNNKNEIIIDLMKYVKNNHTYINRINTIKSFIKDYTNYIL